MTESNTQRASHAERLEMNLGTPTAPPQTARQPHPCAAILRAIADGATEFEYSPSGGESNDWTPDNLEGVLIAIAYGDSQARYRVKGSAA